MKKKFIVLFLLFSAFGFAQNPNEYKYAMVPAKFSFFKEENQYNLNLLTKMYLQKYGFETYYVNETAPDEFVNSNCNKIYIDVLENNNMFTTKLKVVVKDCKGTILATSEEGISRDKEYRVAYNEALRMAFDNFSILKTHKFQPTEKKLEVIEKPLFLIAKKQIEGFDLITKDSENVYMSLKATSLKEVYIAIRKETVGIFFKENETWFFEYYSNNLKLTEKINVIF